MTIKSLGIKQTKREHSLRIQQLESAVEQNSIVPIVGGVGGAVLLLAIGLGIWCRQKRYKKQPEHAIDDMPSTIIASDEGIGQVLSSSSPAASDSLLPSDKKVALPTTPLNELPVPEKVSLFNHLERLPLERKIENLSSLKVALPENIKTFTAPPNSVTASEGSSNMSSQPAASDHTSKALPESLIESSSLQMALPDNPRDWNQDETAQWILERFGDDKLSSLALSQKINGRALLMLQRQDMISALKLETVGEQLLFEEAVAELRGQSAQLSALAQENPPSYE
ncbi:hypothetical protein HDU77_000242 [Chytriomyces hyalinus]|nr:hypothetical protein HDU77_000242 [Chytriomyces hyalinus]